MYLNKRTWNFLQKYFSTKPFVKEVLLYGSYAKGTALITSDIDLILEVDYKMLSGHSFDFVVVGTELSTILDVKVSIATKESFSQVIGKFAYKDSIVIYELNKTVNTDWVEKSIDFDKEEYRDYARLEHINNSFQLVALWGSQYLQENIDNRRLIVGACVNELQLLSGLAQRLTPATLDELLDSTLASDSDSVIGAIHIFSLLKNLTKGYFGVDEKILLDIINYDIPAYRVAAEKLLKSWESRFKERLLKHFVRFVILRVNEDIRKSASFIEEFDIVSHRIKNTLDRNSLLDLTPDYIDQGERNLIWIAFQFNIKKRWADIVDIICPFFPIC